MDSDPTMDALVDSIKAFGIATALVFGGSAALIGSLAWKWGSTDVESFLATFRDRYIAPFSNDVLKPLMPDTVKEKINKYLTNPEDIEEINDDERNLEEWFRSTDTNAATDAESETKAKG